MLNDFEIKAGDASKFKWRAHQAHFLNTKIAENLRSGTHLLINYLGRWLRAQLFRIENLADTAIDILRAARATVPD